MLMLIPNCSANHRPDEEERETGQTKLGTMKSFTIQTRSKSEQAQIAVQEPFPIISQIPVGFVEFQRLSSQARALWDWGTSQTAQETFSIIPLKVLSKLGSEAYKHIPSLLANEGPS